MDWLQALGATNYLGKEKPKSQTHRGEELSLLPSAIKLRTGSRPRGGVEQLTPKGVVTCKGGRDRALLLTEILNTEETETIDTVLCHRRAIILIVLLCCRSLVTFTVLH